MSTLLDEAIEVSYRQVLVSNMDAGFVVGRHDGAELYFK